MIRIIAQVTQKGGNGKTSITLNIGYEFGKRGKRVLLIDIDPQASLSKNLIGEDALPGFGGIEDLFLNPDLDPAEFILATKMENVSIIPSHASLSGVPAKLIYDGDGFFTLKNIVKKISGFDYILLDTPGNLEFLTLSSFIASHHLIIPIYPALYSLLSINELTTAIEKMKRNFNADVEILGVVLTMMDRRANLYREIEEEVRGFFGRKVFNVTTSRTVKSEEAALKSTGVSGVYPESNLGLEYQALIREITDRITQNNEV